MIMMEQPSISINSHDVPGPNYKMWRTIVAPESTDATAVVRMIERHNVEAVSAKKSPLRNIIINCHGLEGGGRLSVGGEGHVGIHQGNVGMFASLRPLNVGTIWLVACQAAAGPNGMSLCRAMAQNAGTIVIAGDEDQELGVWGTYRYYVGLSGQIDDYEGTVYAFWPNGSVSRDIDPEDIVFTVKV
jgi:hypothetical protein